MKYKAPPTSHSLKIIFIGVVIVFTFLFFQSERTNSGNANDYSEKELISQDSNIQKEILTYKEIDSVLNTFQKTPYSKIDSQYLAMTAYQGRPDEYKVSGLSFYVLRSRDLNKNLVGKHSANEFLPKDKFWKPEYGIADSCIFHYFLINKEILHKFSDLICLMKKLGYNADALKIMDGYRYPSFNTETGGADFSQHLYGRAIDLEIGDINNDGRIDEALDKKIIIDLLDTQIIKNKGGIGLYPGTQIVHFDTRGKYARWESN